MFAVTTRAQSKADHARESPPEEPPTEAPPPEPPPTSNAPHTQTQAPAPKDGEIGLPDMEDNLAAKPLHNFT